MRRKYILLFLILSVFSTFAIAGSKKEQEKLEPTAEHSIIAKEVATILSKYSYKHLEINDSISAIIFENLIKNLDSNKNYFLKQDIDLFNTYKYKLSQAFTSGDLTIPFLFYNIYKKRYLERINCAISILHTTQNYSKREYYIANREKLNWFENQKEADINWRKRVKFDLLNMQSARQNGYKNLPDSQTIDNLTKRYHNLLSQANKLNANDAFQVIMKALTDAIDPHTSYFNPTYAQAFNEGLANTFEGIGARLSIDNETVIINEIIAGGPVSKNKSIHVNDKIIGVAQGTEDDFEDIIGWRLDAAIAKMKGPKGTTVRLKLIPAGQSLSTSPKIVTLRRDKIVVEDESAKKEIKEIISSDGKRYRLGVIKIPKFYMDFAAFQRKDPNYKSTSRDVRLILDTLKQQKVDAILIDLRFNGGGSLPEAIELTGLFIDQGPVVQIRNTQNKITLGADEDKNISWSGPLGILLNRFSASASEIFAAAIQDYGRGIVLGSQSYGKGTVQTGFPMARVLSPEAQDALLKLNAEQGDNSNDPNKYGQINLTLSKFYRVTGNSTQLKGVTPDIVFPTDFMHDKYGESALQSALPWDTVASSDFNKTADLGSVIQQLSLAHKKRMNNAIGYKYLLEDIKKNQREDIAKIDLASEHFYKQRNKTERQYRKRVNSLLKSQGKALWKNGGPEPQFDHDFVKEESLQVMVDFMTENNLSQ